MNVEYKVINLDISTTIGEFSAMMNELKALGWRTHKEFSDQIWTVVLARYSAEIV